MDRFIRMAPIVIGLAFAIAAATGCKPSSKLSSSQLQDLEQSNDSWFELFRPASLVRASVEDLQRQKIKLNTRILKFNMLDILGVGANFNVQTRQTAEGLYQRSEILKLGIDLAPGTLLTSVIGAALPINISLASNREIEFVRLFQSYREAATALPKSLIDLPLNVEKALALQPGDIVSFPVNMGLKLGLGQSAGQNSGTSGVFWNGSFRITVFRLDEGFVRVKATSERSDGLFLNAQISAELDLFGYGPFGLINLDSQAERGLGLDFVRFAQQKVRSGDKLSVDYVFNLNDRDGALAFRAMVADTLKIKAAKLASLAANIAPVDVRTFANLDYAETLSSFDEHLPGQKRRVSRVFRGSNAYSGRNLSGHLGTKILRAKSSNSLTFNTINQYLSRNRDSLHQYFLFNKSRSLNSFISPLRRQFDLTATAIFSEGQVTGQADKFLDFAFGFNTRERTLKTSERGDLLAKLKAILGPYTADFSPERILPQNTADKFSSKLQIAFSSALLDKMTSTGRSDPDLYEKQLWYALGLITPQFAGRIGPRTSGDAENLAGAARNFFKSSLESIRNTVRTAVRLRFEGIHGNTVSDLIRFSLRLPETGPVVYFANIMSLLEKDESAEEIVPAFFLMLAYKYQSAPSISLVHNWEGLRQPLERHSGENPHTVLEDDLARAYSHINSLGYDR